MQMQQDPTSHAYCSLVLLPAASTLVLASYGQCPPLQVCDTVECCSGNAGPLLCTCTHMPQATASHRLLALHTPIRVSQTHDSRGH